MQVMLMRLMSKGEYLIVPKGTKFKGSGKLGLKSRASFKNGRGALNCSPERFKESCQERFL